MRKLITGLSALILLSAILAAGTWVLLHSTQTPAIVPEAAAAPPAPSTNAAAPVVAQATVIPARSVRLSFPARGVVGESVVSDVRVREGDVVQQGAPLARLDTRDLELRVQEADAALAQARADHDKLRAQASSATVPSTVSAAPSADPAAAATLASAEAKIRQAEATLQRAQLALEQATLLAPMAGTVVVVNLNVGEVPSVTDAAIVLADVSSWQIETTNLTEQNVVQIAENDPATITFSSLPGLELPGKVTQINAVGQRAVGGGDASYTVVITPDQQDERLRWNMSASVAIGDNK